MIEKIDDYMWKNNTEINLDSVQIMILKLINKHLQTVNNTKHTKIDITIDTKYVDLFESLELLHALMILEDTFHIKIADEDAEKFQTIEDSIVYIYNALQNKSHADV